MNILTRSLVSFWIIFASLTPGVTLAADEDITLERVLKSVVAKNGQVLEASQDVEVARAQLARARAAIYPRVEATIIAAPIFEERGTPQASTVNYGKWGPFITGGVQAIQPLYTFGQISSYGRAAEGQIVAKENLTEAKRLEMVALAKEFYYGYQMAQDLEHLVDNLAKFLEEAVNTADEQLKSKKKKSNVKLHDVYRLKTSLEDLRQKKLMAIAGRQTAEKAVAWVAGEELAKLPSRKLKPQEYEKKPLDEYLRLSKAFRPEFTALSAGQQAYQALAAAKQAQSYPVIFLGAFVSHGWSPVRDRQQSIYANDPFNRLNGGVGLGIKFDLEFWRHSAEASEQEAEAMKLKAKEGYAVPGIELQVKKAYWELEQAAQGLEIADARRQIAKKWFIQSAMGWSIGITPAKDLLEALEGDGMAKKNHIETIYALNLALAKLSAAVGKEVTKLSYR